VRGRDKTRDTIESASEEGGTALAGPVLAAAMLPPPCGYTEDRPATMDTRPIGECERQGKHTRDRCGGIRRAQDGPTRGRQTRATITDSQIVKEPVRD